jgi:hypothetical protein
VVVYTQVTADATGSHLTYVYDGRSGDLTASVQDGVVPVDGSERTFGLFYDGDHFRYVRLNNHPPE